MSAGAVGSFYSSDKAIFSRFGDSTFKVETKPFSYIPRLTENWGIVVGQCSAPFLLLYHPPISDSRKIPKLVLTKADAATTVGGRGGGGGERC